VPGPDWSTHLVEPKNTPVFGKPDLAIDSEACIAIIPAARSRVGRPVVGSPVREIANRTATMSRSALRREPLERRRGLRPGVLLEHRSLGRVSRRLRGKAPGTSRGGGRRRPAQSDCPQRCPRRIFLLSCARFADERRVPLHRKRDLSIASALPEVGADEVLHGGVLRPAGACSARRRAGDDAAAL